MRKIWMWMMIAVMAVLVTVVPAQAKNGSKLVALTFDDVPSGKYTEALLDGLKERDVKVTFFMLGQNAQNYPSIVRRAAEEGHEIGCHSWNHPDLTDLSDEEIRAQLQRCYSVMDPLCGQDGRYLVRPPYGSVNDRVCANIENPIVYWSVDSRDWESQDTAKVRERILDDVYDGAIILCHDIHGTTIPAAMQVIDKLTEEGYEFVTVSELFRRRGVEMKNGVIHYNCKANGVDLGPLETEPAAVPTDAPPPTVAAVEPAFPAIAQKTPQSQTAAGSTSAIWWIVILFLLSAAFTAFLWDGKTRTARQFLNQCRDSHGLQFRAAVRTCQEHREKTVMFDCAVEENGEVWFQIIRPEGIDGARNVVLHGTKQVLQKTGELQMVAAPCCWRWRCGKDGCVPADIVGIKPF